MTPEDVLGSLVSHSQALVVGTPDPLVMENRAAKIGKRTPMNWRRLQVGSGDPAGILELWPGTRSAHLRDFRNVSRFSVSEIAADALSNMPATQWQTLQVAIGAGNQVRGILITKLTRIARREQKRNVGNVWPAQIRRQACRCHRSAAADYVPDLVELTLLELEHPMMYHTHRDRCRWFGLSERAWYAGFRQPHDRVSRHVWSWYHAGIGHIKGRISLRNRSNHVAE